jgi:AcrR family transcriptional regulator
MGAAEVFGQQGYADTSVADILEASQVSRRTFYKLFRNKEDVFAELFEAASMIFLQSMRNAAAIARTPAEKIGNAIEVYLRAPETAGPIFHVMQLEASRPGTRLAERRDAAIETLVEMFQEGIREEQGREVDPWLLRGVIAALDAITRHVYTRTDATEEDLQRAKETMVHIVTSTLSPPTAEAT